MSDFLSLKALLLYAFLGFVFYTHTRGKVKLRIKHQIFDHSTFFAPYNVLMDLFSALPRQPVLERSKFSHLDPLKESWKVLRDEALALYQSGDIKVAEKHDDIAFNSFFKTGWKRFYIKWYDDVMPSAERLCPRSVELVNAIPEVNAAMFAMLPPDGRLGQHRDPFGGSFRYHLGLSTPNSDDCYILVDDQFYSWRDGEDIVFDETYVHQAKNDTDQLRFILFCDVTRPLKTGPMRRFNQYVIKNVIKISKSHNTDEEKIGGLNYIANGIFKTKLFFGRLKKFNRRGYYTLKYLLLAWLLYSIFF